MDGGMAGGRQAGGREGREGGEGGMEGERDTEIDTKEIEGETYAYELAPPSSQPTDLNRARKIRK